MLIIMNEKINTNVQFLCTYRKMNTPKQSNKSKEKLNC